MIDENLLLEDLIYCKGLGRRGIEAVVKELEELKQIEMNDECPMDICGDCECSKYKCKGCYTGKAIEIVRNGGVK